MDKTETARAGTIILHGLMKRKDEVNDNKQPVARFIADDDGMGATTFLRYDAVVKAINDHFAALKPEEGEVPKLNSKDILRQCEAEIEKRVWKRDKKRDPFRAGFVVGVHYAEDELKSRMSTALSAETSRRKEADKAVYELQRDMDTLYSRFDLERAFEAGWDKIDFEDWFAAYKKSDPTKEYIRGKAGEFAEWVQKQCVSSVSYLSLDTDGLWTWSRAGADRERFTTAELLGRWEEDVK